MQVIHPSALPTSITYIEVATTGNAPAQMWANTEATTTTAKPCIRDFSELVNKEVPEAFAKLVPLKELKRRLSEVVRVKPRFREEAPIMYRLEEQRRAAFAQPQLG
jgi:hypothetical protein